MREMSFGIYTLRDAQRLTGVNSSKMRRWLFGYSFKTISGDGTRDHFSAPLWATQYGRDQFDDDVIGFRDLLELRVINEFVKAGVPLIVVRNCLEEAKKFLKSDYPFTSNRFLTDGKTIYHEALSRTTAEPSLVDLRKHQHAINEVIRPSLYAGIEYDGLLARRWFPMPRQKSIVLDPEVSFGKPHLAASGVPTEAIYASYLAESEDINRVARLFEIEKKQVEAAVKFEESLAA
jgi:uncharacterized protein (DUF433 family)